MTLLKNVTKKNTATIAVDCLNTFMKAQGHLSISVYQKGMGEDGEEVQREIDGTAQRMGELRKFLYQEKVPQIQFQDGHVVEWVHGKRFHSLEIVRQGEEPDYLRTFPPHALLDKNRRFGTEDQQAIEEIFLPDSQQVFIRWFDSHLPPEAVVEPQKELIFLKDDFCMSPGSPFTHPLFWDLRRQGRFNLILFGVCDEVCNLRNVLLLLSAIFNILYVEDCTYPLDPKKRQPAIEYMKGFNPLGDGSTGQFQVVSSKQIMDHFSAL